MSADLYQGSRSWVGVGVGDPFLLFLIERSNSHACSSFYGSIIPVRGKGGLAGAWLCFMCWPFLTCEPITWPRAVIRPMLKGSASMVGPNIAAWCLGSQDRRFQPSRGSVAC